MFDGAKSGINVLEGDERGIINLREMRQKVSIFVCLLPLQVILCAESQSCPRLGCCSDGRHPSKDEKGTTSCAWYVSKIEEIYMMCVGQSRKFVISGADCECVYLSDGGPAQT